MQVSHVPSQLAAAGLLGTLVLLPFGSGHELGLALCLLATGMALWRGWRPWSDPGVRLFAVAWAAYVLAALWSLPDAVDLKRSSVTALASLRFLGYGLAGALLGSAERRWLLPAAACVVGMWILDALLQAATGFSLGGVSAPERISGIFGADDLKLGPVLAACAGLTLAAIRRWPLWSKALWLLALSGAVMLAGNRSGWLSFALVALWWAWRELRARQWRSWPLLLGGSTVILLLGVALYSGSSQFAERVDRTLRLFSTDRGEVDTALAFRLPIWETATRMAVAHPLNGVGVRGFRKAYPEFADSSDRFVQINQGLGGASHPHQLLLELLCETGLPGLVLWLLAAVLLIRAWREADPDRRLAAWPYAAGALAMAFPLNTHLAFYSSFWGSLWFWLLALYCCSLRSTEPTPT